MTLQLEPTHVFQTAGCSSGVPHACAAQRQSASAALNILKRNRMPSWFQRSVTAHRIALKQQQVCKPAAVPT